MPTIGTVIKVIVQERTTWANCTGLARASHVVAGTKMTPVAERWPEPRLCSAAGAVPGCWFHLGLIARPNRLLVTRDARGLDASWPET